MTSTQKSPAEIAQILGKDCSRFSPANGDGSPALALSPKVWLRSSQRSTCGVSLCVQLGVLCSGLVQTPSGLESSLGLSVCLGRRCSGGLQSGRERPHRLGPMIDGRRKRRRQVGWGQTVAQGCRLSPAVREALTNSPLLLHFVQTNAFFPHLKTNLAAPNRLGWMEKIHKWETLRPLCCLTDH